MESEEDIRLWEYWKKNMSPREIAEAMEKPVGFVYARLRVLQKRLVDKQGVEHHETKIHT